MFSDNQTHDKFMVMYLMQAGKDEWPSHLLLN